MLCCLEHLEHTATQITDFNSFTFMKKILFIDRDGTILVEPQDEQIDSFDKFKFVDGVIRNLHFIRTHTDFEFVMVSNQDGLGTSAYPEEDFWPTQNLMLQTLKSEGVVFDDIYIDRSFPEDNLPTRKPGTAMLTKYIEGDYDLKNSYVIGDRKTDMLLAENLGCKSLIIGDNMSWDKIAELIYAGERKAEIKRFTKETDIFVSINLDGSGISNINTGLGFFNHMLEQISRHSNIDLTIDAKGDLNVDEHHTIEDTAISLGACIDKALGNKKGIERYGFLLPMDDSLCQVAIDFGGRTWFVWDVEFKREYVGDVPTEMFMHFFKSLSDSANINLNIKAEGLNDHHKIEGIFKAFARALKMAIRRDISHFTLPSTKGCL